MESHLLEGVNSNPGKRLLERSNFGSAGDGCCERTENIDSHVALRNSSIHHTNPAAAGTQEVLHGSLGHFSCKEGKVMDTLHLFDYEWAVRYILLKRGKASWAGRFFSLDHGTLSQKTNQPQNLRRCSHD